jgi:hypothetical protein
MHTFDVPFPLSYLHLSDFTLRAKHPNSYRRHINISKISYVTIIMQTATRMRTE